MTAKRQHLIRTGYAIFCPTVFQGTMPACYEDDYPLAFATELDAQRDYGTPIPVFQAARDGVPLLSVYARP